MDKRTVITMSGAAALAVLAVVAKSVTMFVSAGAIGVIVYFFRHARARDKVIAIIAAALGGSIATEIVLTIYRHTSAAGGGAAADSGDAFLSAIQVGLGNAGAIAVVLIVAELWLQFAARNSP